MWFLVLPTNSSDDYYDDVNSNIDKYQNYDITNYSNDIQVLLIKVNFKKSPSLVNVEEQGKSQNKVILNFCF